MCRQTLILTIMIAVACLSAKENLTRSPRKKRLDNAAFHDWVINTQCEAMGSSWGGKMPGKAG
jgi:hypothetical protein